jgi:hypothetical protein
VPDTAVEQAKIAAVTVVKRIFEMEMVEKKG